MCAALDAGSTHIWQAGMHLVYPGLDGGQGQATAVLLNVITAMLLVVIGP